jgi:LPXTG-motif cell wall-anchored protein
MAGFGNLFSSDSTTSQPITNNTGGAQAAGSAQIQGGNKNRVNTGTIQTDASKNSHNTEIGNSTINVKGSGSVNYTTTNNGLTGNDLAAFENQIAGSLNSGNSGSGSGSSTGFEFGNPSPTTAQGAIATTGSNIKWAIGAGIALAVALAVYLFTSRKKK